MKGSYSFESVCCECGAPFAVRPCNATRSVRCRSCRKVHDNERRKAWRRTHPPAVPRRRKKEVLAAYASRRRELARGYETNLLDSRVRARIIRDFGISSRAVTPGMINAKRQAVIAVRAVRALQRLEGVNGARHRSDAVRFSFVD